MDAALEAKVLAKMPRCQIKNTIENIVDASIIGGLY
jgi:hypothetical protein